MDKFDKFLEDIEKKTKCGELTWHITPPGQYADYIFNPQFIFQTYDSKYSIGDNDYTLVLVQRKDKITNDYEETFEKYSVNILLIQSGKLIFTLSDSHADRAALLRLARWVENLNDDAAAFFKNFE